VGGGLAAGCRRVGAGPDPRLVDGTFAAVPPEDLPAVAAQLARLRDGMAARGYDLDVEHLDDILPALAAVRPGEDEVSIG
jgi:hypothetical protein